MERSAALPVWNRLFPTWSHPYLRASGVETPETAWVKSYKEVCRAWTSRLDERRGSDGTEWFADSCFKGLGKTSVTVCHQVTITDLVGRALSKSSTSSEILAKGQARFETEIAGRARSLRSGWSVAGADRCPSFDLRSPLGSNFGLPRPTGTQSRTGCINIPLQGHSLLTALSCGL